MSLVTCTECGRGVSTEAAACPGCGRPRQAVMPAPPSTVYLEGIDGPARRGGGPSLAAAAAVLVLGAVATGGVMAARSAHSDFHRVETTFETTVVEVPGAPLPIDGAETVERVHIATTVEAVPAPPADGAVAFELSEVDVAPELANRGEVAAALSRLYPPLLRDAGVHGQVVLRFRVTPEGTVDRALVDVESASHDAFIEAAHRALAETRFTPARVDGEPVSVWVTLPMAFALDP